MSLPFFLTPAEIIRRQVAATLRAFDWVAAGMEAAPTIRHARRRFASPDEYPCITIRWEQDEPRAVDMDQHYITPGEMFMEQSLTLEIDTDPGAEDADGNNYADDDDETGLGYSDAIAMTAVSALKDPEGVLRRLWCNDVIDQGRGEDPDSTNDEARLNQRIIVLYRVSTEDPSVMLAEGMNL